MPRFLLFLTLLVTSLNLQAGELKLGPLQADEGGENFSLDVRLSLQQGDEGGEHEEYGARGGVNFDSVGLYDHVRVSPATRFSISAKRNGFLLVGDFKPETKYKIILKNGLSSREGHRLSADAEGEVTTGSFAPRFAFKDKARYMPGTLQGALQWEAVNVQAVEFEVRQVYTANIHQWVTSGEQANEFVSDAVKTVSVPVKGIKNKITRGSFSLSDLDTLGQGVFVVVAKKPSVKTPPAEPEGEVEGEYDPYAWRTEFDRATLIVTNLSVVAKTGAQQVKVWVAGTRDLSPVKDAQVDLISTSNRKIDSCRTSGVNAECSLRWKKLEPPLTPYALVVRSGKDFTFLRLADVNLPNDAFQAGKRAYSGGGGGMDAYVYGERDLYRPGETVQLAAMVRTPSFQAVPRLPLRWTITSPRGKVVRESVSDTSDSGLARLEYATTPASDTGRYKIAVSAGNAVLHETSVLLEEFVPERVGLRVTPARDVVVGKSEVPFQIAANYLFGPPVAKGHYKVACSMRPAFTEIPNRPGFATGIYSLEDRQTVTLDEREAELSAAGTASEICAIGAAAGRMAEAFEIKARVEVNEAGGGRATVKNGSAIVAGTDTLVGLKLEGSRAGAIHVRGGLFDFKGMSKSAKASLKVKLFNIREHWYYTSGAYDSWKTEEIISPTSVEKTVEVSGSSFDFELTPPPEMWGKWMVRAVDTRTGYTADLNAGYLGWSWGERRSQGARAPEPGGLKVELSKTAVSPGEKIQAMIEAPFAGRVLFAFETDQTLETEWVQVDKPGQVKVNLRVPEALPNLYVTALLLKNPVEAGGRRFLPARAWGAASVGVVPAAHQLDVKLMHPEMSESRKKVTIQLANSQSAPAEYTLAAVDEGILQMTEFASPDPLKRFFEARMMGVQTADTLGWTVAMDGDGGKKPGGDKTGTANKNMPVKLVSFWFPGIKSDSAGKAQVQLELPSFQGKLRVMAVASGKTRMGSAVGALIVRDPLVLQSTLPRFLTQGDRFQFPVNVMNLSGKDQTVGVEVAGAGPLLHLGANKQTLVIPNGQSRVARFDADVRGVSGVAGIKISAKASDGRLTSIEEFSLPVKPSGVEQSIRLALDTRGGEISLASHIPVDWRQDHMQLDATVSPLPYLDQLSQLEELIHYPYGCIEQTTSATLPLLTMGDLLDWVDTKKKAAGNIKTMVGRGIARVLSMQTASGGFGYWPGDGRPSEWGTAYATYMLLEAKKAGFDVPAAALDSALNYLENEARGGDYQLVNRDAKTGRSADPFMLYVAAKGGRDIAPALRSALRGFGGAPARWTGLSGENYFLLAATAKLIGDKESLRKLADPSVYSIALTGAVDDEYTYWSGLRSDGLRLAILQEVSPSHPAVDPLTARVAAALGKQKSMYSTQEIGWSVLALGKRIAGIKRADAAGLARAKLTVNGRRLEKAYEAAGGPGFHLEGPGLSAAKLQVSDAPAGVSLYVKATGFTKAPPVANAPLRIQRQFYKRDGSGVNPADIKLGDTVFVELLVQNTGKRKIHNVAVVDRLPAGFELENPRLGKSESLGWMKEPFKAEYQDLRDDRIQIFGDLDPDAKVSIYYSARAVTKGRFTAPAAMVEAMYDPGNFSYDRDTPVQIVDAAVR